MSFLQVPQIWSNVAPQSGYYRVLGAKVVTSKNLQGPKGTGGALLSAWLIY